MSWVNQDNVTSGNPIGMGSNLTFSGSGEMENGWGVALTVAMNNQDAYSNTNVVVTVPTLGDIKINSGVSGTGIDRIDDVTPNVWEEAYAVGVGSGIQTVNGGSGGSTIEFTPNMMPDGITARIAYTPDAGGSLAADKATAASAASNPEDSAYDITIAATDAIHGMAGLTINAGIAQIEQDSNKSGISGDEDEQTIAITYAAGAFTVGYQWSEQDLGTDTNETEYENTAYGITFNVNDDLSVGYNYYESEQTSGTNATAKAQSVQIAYSMGGASIRLAEGEVDNAAYQTGAAYDKDVTTLSVSLAF
jgi:outer membrane protein OmpU